MARPGKRRTPTQSCTAGRIRATRVMSAIGEQLREARRRRGWAQLELAGKVGISQVRLSQLEAGKGGGEPADLWLALADALGMHFRMEFGRDPHQELEDAGHLEMQEFMLRLGKGTGFGRTYELATRPANPAFSADVGLG